MGHGSSKRWTAVLVTVALIGVGLIPSVDGAAVAPSASATTTWAYGGQRWVNVSEATPNGSATYTARAFFGVQVLLTQTNTSSTTFELTANRTMVGDLSVSYCRPDCTNPVGTAVLTVRAWEVTNATANFTTNGSVLGPSGTVPALALLDSAVRVAANVTEIETANYSGLFGSHTASKYVSAHVSARAKLQFSPALGLVPNNLSATAQWSANSTFVGAAHGALGYVYSYSPFSGQGGAGAGSDAVSVNTTGNISLRGSDAGPVVLQGGVPTTAVHLIVSGPFSVREGFIVLPAGADLFDGAGAWMAQSAGAQSASTNALDYGTRDGGHAPIDASATAYAGSSNDLDSASPVALAGPSDNAGSTTLQAEPETVGMANSQSSCYLSSTCLAQPGGAPTTHAGLGGVIVLTVAVVGLAVVVVGLVVARQPPRKDPPSPNANLYPQGAAAGPSPSVRPAAPVPPPRDDPLGHLW